MTVERLLKTACTEAQFDGAALREAAAVLSASDLSLKRWVAPDLASRSLALSADGARLYALAGDAVQVIDTTTGAVRSRLAAAAGARAIHLIAVP